MHLRQIEMLQRLGMIELAYRRYQTVPHPRTLRNDKYIGNIAQQILHQASLTILRTCSAGNSGNCCPRLRA